VGVGAGQFNQSTSATAVGQTAGRYNQGISSTAVGYLAGHTSQGDRTVAIGREAGNTSQGNYGIAIGYVAAESTQSVNSIAIGRGAAQTSQGADAIAMGYIAGRFNQGSNAVALGYAAGETSQHDNSIVLNASGSALDTEGTGRTYIKPLRVATVASNVMTYDQATGEVMDSGIQATPVIYKAYLVNGTGIDVNASVTYTEYDIFDTGYTESINSGSFTLSGTTKVVAPSTGYYRLSFNICFLGSGGQRTNIGVKPVIEGTELDEYSGSDYIRYTNDHNEATTNMTTLIHLTGNREVGLAFARLTSITDAVYIDPGSYIILEKI
jgi:hypothetical protein